MKWQEKTSVKKGNIGEEIVENYLLKQGLNVYKPICQKSHPFDRLLSRDRINIIIADIKTKPKRKYYPDTGIDFKHYLQYKEISKLHNTDVYIFFVDENLKSVYCGKLSDLEKEKEIIYNGRKLKYPYRDKSGDDIIYFYQPDMNKILNLTDDQVKELKEFTRSNYV